MTYIRQADRPQNAIRHMEGAALMAAISILLLLLAGCSTLDNYWFVDLPGYRPSAITITAVDDIQKACSEIPYPVRACVVRTPTHAQIFVSNKLTQSEYECVMKHEINKHIIEGKNHDDRPIYIADCG